MKTLRVFLLALSLCSLLSSISYSQEAKEAELFGFAQKLFRDGIYDIAAEQFRQFLRDYPKSERAGEAQFMVGEALYSAGAYASAASELQVFLVRFPYHLRAKDAWYRMAQCHLALNRYSEAGMAFLQFQSRFSVDERAPQALLQAADIFLKVKDTARTKRALYIFFEEYPQNKHQWRAKLLRARLYRFSAVSDSAFILFNEVIASQIDDLTPIALLEKGQLLGEIERYDEAVEAYSEIVKTYPQSTLIDQAQFQLGLLYYNRNQFIDAISPFEIIVETFPQSHWYTTALLYLAHALRQSAEDSSAIEVYEKCLIASHDTSYQEAEYGLALSLANVGRTYEALERLEEVQHRFTGSEYASQAALKVGDILLSLGNYEAAVDKYRAYILRHPEVGKSDRLQMTIGEIYEKRMGRYQRAADEYHRVLTDYPQSPLTYDALLAIGRCYEQLGDFNRARSAYEDVISTDPKSIFAERARLRIEWNDQFRLRNLEGATAELLSLLDQSAIVKEEDLTFRIAKVTSEKLKDFERTAEIMEAFLRENPRSLRSAEALYVVAESYEYVSKNASFEGNDSLRVASLRQAEKAYRRLRDGYPDSRWADDAELFLIDTKFGSGLHLDSAATREMIDRYNSLIEAFPGSDRLDEVRVRMGDAHMKAVEWEGLEAYDEAIDHFEMVSKNGEKAAEATLKIGLCHQEKDQCELALDRFEEVKQRYPESPLALDAQLGIAHCLISVNRYSEAIDTYRTIVYRYPQSQLAREIRIQMGDLFAQSGDFERAKESYDRVFEQGYDIPPDLHYKMADVLRSLGETKEAVTQYKRYLNIDPDGEYVSEAYYGLARVQEQRGSLEAAAQEYRRLIEEYPDSPSVIEAKGRIALVLFKLGQYEEARTTSLGTLTADIGDSLRTELEAKIVIASYRLGDVVTAETKAKEFKKAFPNQKTYLAQFDLEKGYHHLSTRNGQDALLAFENLLSDYPESSLVDDAQYGIGLTCLDDGDFEKAIEAFRTLVQDNPKSDLVPSVYLKLGNIYHLQMNFEDAAFAYRRVIDDERSGELVPTAMFNLIRTYEAANRQDQALQAAKNLVRHFPHYEDALRVRIKIGYLNAELGNFADAINALEDVLPDVDADEEPEVRYWIGESYYDSGKYDQALLEYLKVAYLSQPGGLWAVTAEFKAGQTYEALGRIDEAKRLYRGMIERYGTNSQWGQAALERLRELEG